MRVLVENVVLRIYYFAEIGEPFTISIDDALELKKMRHKKKKFKISKSLDYATVWRTK